MFMKVFVLTFRFSQCRYFQEKTSSSPADWSLERLSEVVLVLLIGGTLSQNSWSWRAISLALFLFVVARPVSVLVGLMGTRTSWRIRGMAGWFGVRGIGSLYYLMYAINHGLDPALADALTSLTLSVVVASIVVHGISVTPLMSMYEKTIASRVRRGAPGNQGRKSG